MKIQPPPEVEKMLAAQWRFTLDKVAEALRVGIGSTEHTTATVVSLTFVTAVMCCYGFSGDKALSQTNAYLEELLRRYPNRAG